MANLRFSAHQDYLFCDVSARPPNALADPELLAQVEAEVKKEIEIIKELSAYASQYPYYK